MSMKHVTALIALLMMIGSQVSAAETVMVCDAEAGQKEYLKLVDPFWGKSQILFRRDGQWQDWCKIAPSKAQCDVEIYQSGAKLVWRAEAKHDKDYGIKGRMKGDPLLITRTYVLDFEFQSRHQLTESFFAGDDGSFSKKIGPSWAHNSLKYACASPE